MAALSKKVAVATLSVVSNTLLIVIKLTAGFFMGSVSVISEAIHSGVDLVAAIIALLAVRTSSTPADDDHPFGHGKIENLSGTIEALLIFLAAGWIIYEAIMKLIHPHPLQTLGWGVLVMLLSSLINIVVSHLLFKVGRETDSMALKADAWHLRTDVYTSASVMVGLVAIWIGQHLFPAINLNWIDPAAAILVALLILKAAYHLTIQSGKDLLDARLPPEEEEWIRDYIASFKPVVRGLHRLRTRKAGHYRFVECHVWVDSSMSVESSHDITHTIGAGIRQHFPDTHVILHIEPCKLKCHSTCQKDCLLDENERLILKQRVN